MTLKFRIRVLAANSEEIEAADGTFDNEAESRLRRFALLGTVLRDTKLVREGHPRPLRWTLSATGQSTVDLPPEEVLDQFFLRMRPFVLQKESTFFPKIRNLLYSHIESPVVREKLQTWKRQFSGAMILQTYRLTVADEVINSERMLGVWLNGSVYHDFDDKRAELEAVYEVVPEPICRFFFFDLLTAKAAAILAMADFIERMLAAPSARDASDQ